MITSAIASLETVSCTETFRGVRAFILDEADPIEHQTLADEVYTRLESILAFWQLAPYEKLPLRAVSEIFGTAMMLMREAVTRFVSDCALEVVRGRAVGVPVMTLGQFEDLPKIRVAIEGYAPAETSRNCLPQQLATIC